MLHGSDSSNSCRITKPCTYILNILHFLLYTKTNNLFIHVICVEVCNIVTKEKTYYIMNNVRHPSVAYTNHCADSITELIHNKRLVNSLLID